jgi:hypothetical protein
VQNAPHLLQQRTRSGLAHAQALANGGEDEDRIVKGRQVDEGDAVAELAAGQTGGFDRQPGLANAAGADQRDQVRLRLAQQVHDGRQVALPADQ